ncbi:hypothetical protein BDV23DRAFT_165169 [Aspergillus alliaceus]|uniref:Uncharacterized protein n=1 Tax=Petromyces alliaceus TaxID=209559 RepID=A0A5N7BUK3_PETAA|nr:hypothetical protein BDV23DRAFT_165169 [Aspergillus alliaceus]
MLWFHWSTLRDIMRGKEPGNYPYRLGRFSMQLLVLFGFLSYPMRTRPSRTWNKTIYIHGPWRGALEHEKSEGLHFRKGVAFISQYLLGRDIP